MDEKTTLELVKDSQQLLSTFYGDLAQPSVKKVGKALETVVDFCTTIFLPIKFQSKKWKLNFEKRLENYKKNLDNIPEEKIVEVNPQIGAPIMEKLSYVTNDEIAEMFINLLTKASSCDTVNLAHPSFVQLIERLSVDEAKILANLADKQFIPYVCFRLEREDLQGYVEIRGKKTMLQFENDLLFPQNLDTYIDNLISIGILSDKDGTYKTDENIYLPLLEKYGYENLKTQLQATLPTFKALNLNKSYLEITSFGKSFINACTKK